MQDNNKTLIKTVKTPLKLSETHSKTRTRPCVQANLQMSILQQEDNMYAYMYGWHGDILREEPGVLKRASKDKKWQFLIHLQIINIWPSVKSFGHPKINGTGNVTQISAAVFKPLLSVLSWTVRWCPWPARAPDVRLSVWRWTYGILTRFVSNSTLIVLS